MWGSTTTSTTGAGSSSGGEAADGTSTGEPDVPSSTLPSSTGPATDTTTTGPDPVCGDGTVDVGEECDDGRGNGAGKACKADCVANVCGDGDLGPGEACDDGYLRPSTPRTRRRGEGGVRVAPMRVCGPT